MKKAGSVGRLSGRVEARGEGKRASASSVSASKSKRSAAPPLPARKATPARPAAVARPAQREPQIVVPRVAVRPPSPPKPPEDPRSAGFRQLLNAKRQELLGNLEDAKFDTLARLGRVAEEDQAQISHEEFISLRLNSMDYQALRLVQSALDRLDSGDFGVCASCEEEISEKRLRAIPWAKYCVTCQDSVQRESEETSPRPAQATTSEVW
jgi:DnaK suppressor protein